MSAPTATATPTPLLGAVHSTALGISQIFLQENWLTGLLFVVGMAVYSVPMAVLMVVGTIVATAAARLVGAPTAHGLQGYNGALVGCAAWATFSAWGPATLATVIGAAASPAVIAAFAALFGRFHRAGGPLPVLTAPFCVISGLTILLAHALVPAAASSTPTTSPPVPLALAQAVATGIGQVVFVESWIGGLIILAGLFFASWRVGVAAVLGSLLGTLTGWAAGDTPAELTVGLSGYSPTLTAIALAAVFLVPGARAWVWAAIGSVATVGVQLLLALTPIPVLTWPFIVTTWLVLLIEDRHRA